MTLSAMEKKQAQLAKLNEQIKNEKLRIDKALGHEIIKQSGLDYSELNKQSIKDLSEQVSSILKKNDHSENNDYSNN